MSFIRTVSGREFDVDMCGNSNRTLYIMFVGYSFGEIVPIMEDKEETNEIYYSGDNDENPETFVGFTKLTDVMLESQNRIRVTLYNEIGLPNNVE